MKITLFENTEYEKIIEVSRHSLAKGTRHMYMSDIGTWWIRKEKTMHWRAILHRTDRISKYGTTLYDCSFKGLLGYIVCWEEEDKAKRKKDDRDNNNS